jgi:integrase
VASVYVVSLDPAAPGPYRALFALLAGTGIEVSVGLALRARDIDTPRREIRAAGTKTHARDRIVRVAEWAWPYVDKHCALLPRTRRCCPIATAGAPRTTTRPRVPRSASRIAGSTTNGTRMRCAPHAQARRPILSLRQLGHANAVLVLKIYGRFMPSQQERDKWERIAASQDGVSELRLTSHKHSSLVTTNSQFAARHAPRNRHLVRSVM